MMRRTNSNKWMSEWMHEWVRWNSWPNNHFPRANWSIHYFLKKQRKKQLKMNRRDLTWWLADNAISTLNKCGWFNVGTTVCTLGTRCCCDVESTLLTLNQRYWRRNNVAYPVGAMREAANRLVDNQIGHACTSQFHLLMTPGWSTLIVIITPLTRQLSWKDDIFFFPLLITDPPRRRVTFPSLRPSENEMVYLPIPRGWI